MGFFFIKFFQVVIETCEFLKVNLALLFFSRTTCTLRRVPQIFFSLVYKSGNSLKILQKNICCHWSILFSFLFPPYIHNVNAGKRIIFSVLLQFNLFTIQLQGTTFFFFATQGRIFLALETPLLECGLAQYFRHFGCNIQHC